MLWSLQRELAGLLRTAVKHVSEAVASSNGSKLLTASGIRKPDAPCTLRVNGQRSRWRVDGAADLVRSCRMMAEDGVWWLG